MGRRGHTYYYYWLLLRVTDRQAHRLLTTTSASFRHALLQVERKPYVDAVNRGLGVFIDGMSQERATFWKSQTDAIVNLLRDLQVCSILIYKFGML
jgi:hypothetical protein